jgi:hypothetical protein
MMWLLFAALLAVCVVSGRWFDAALMIALLLVILFVAVCVNHIDSTSGKR